METIIQAYGLTIVLIAVIGLMMTVYKYSVGTKLEKQAKQLQIKMMNLRRDFPELDEKRTASIGKGLNQLGIEGLLEEFGIDPNVIQSPIIRSLAEKYAPGLIEGLLKKTSTGEKPETGDKWI